MTKPKYLTLADELRQDILDGKYSKDSRFPSDNELIKQTGLSRQTVRQAIALLEKDLLVNRIRGSGTYVAQGEQRQKTYNVAVLTTYIGEYIFPDILRGIHQVLTENGYTTMLSATRNRVDNERQILTELLNKPIDGMIIEGTKTALPNPNIDLYNKVTAAGIPAVFINGYYPDLQKPVFVVTDDRDGGRQACRHLLKKGHTRIGGIFKSDDIQGHRRYAGYIEEMLKEGLMSEDNDIIWFTTENRDSVLQTALDVLKDCTGVVCYNDEIAVRLLETMRRTNCMGNLEIVSFDRSIYSQMSFEPFYSINSPKEKIGTLAAQKLLKMLSNESVQGEVLPWDLN